MSDRSPLDEVLPPADEIFNHTDSDDAEPGVPREQGEPWADVADRLEDTRGRLQAAAAAIDAHPATAGTDVLDPGTGPHNAWTLEATLVGDRAPAPVVQALARSRLQIREAVPRGTGFHIVATV